MRVFVQRVKYASVKVDGEVKGEIKQGLLAFVGVKQEDTDKELEFCVNKLVGLRIFEDENEKMNLSVKDINGEILIISQFTLYGETKKGFRPSFIMAEEPVKANEMYEKFIKRTKEMSNLKVANGVFGADMKVELLNDGPVTILIEC